MTKTRWAAMSKEKRNEYINKDYVTQNELPFSLLNGKVLRNKFNQLDIYNNPAFGDVNRSYIAVIYEMYFLDNKSSEEIAFHIPHSVRQIQYIIKNMKDKIKKVGTTDIKFNILKEHFINRVPIHDIPNKTNTNKSYVTKVINDYIDLFKSTKKTKY